MSESTDRITVPDLPFRTDSLSTDGAAHSRSGQAYVRAMPRFARMAVAPMSDSVDVLILDLLEWLGSTSRPYVEVLETWRTSCPRLPVWEDANDRGFIERRHVKGKGQFVSVSPAGIEHLHSCRP